MEALEATMNNHGIHLYASSTSSFGHALSVSSYSLNASSSSSSLFSYSFSSSNEWPIYSRSYYDMDKDKSIFSTLSEYKTKHFFVGDNRSLSIVGSRIVNLDDG